jgi:hypothetical protein
MSYRGQEIQKPSGGGVTAIVIAVVLMLAVPAVVAGYQHAKAAGWFDCTCVCTCE